MMMRTVVVVGTLLLGVGAVIAQQSQVKETQATMKNTGKNAGAVAAMLKGEKPYDQATVDAAFAVFAETGKKLPTLFPDSMKGMQPEGDYQISPKVWEDKAEFAAKIEGFNKALATAKPQIKDLDTLKAAFPAVGKACGGCHETFRIKKT